MTIARCCVSASLLLFLAPLCPVATAQESRKRDEAPSTRLLFGVDFQKAIEAGDMGPKDDKAAILKKMIQVMRQRIEASGTQGAKIEAQGNDRILVDLPATEGAVVDVLVGRLIYLGSLEMRMAATDEYNRDGVKFDLAAEQERLKKWLAREENKKRIMADPSAIAAFNRNAGSGKEDGPLSPHLHWLPAYAVKRKRKDAQGVETEVWVYGQPSFSGGSSLKADFAAEGSGAADTNPRFLAINRHEIFFTNQDLVRDAIRITRDDAGMAAIAYEIAPRRAGEYADLSGSNIGKQKAIIVNGMVRCAPVFQSRIPGRGQISLGNADVREAETLAECLKTEGLPLQPELLSRTTVPPK